MASTQILQRRIKSVRSTRQITKAMELVAASKMRRATETAQHGRPYREAAYTLLSRFATVADIKKQPLFKQRPVKTRLYVVITSDRGLAGAYNANVIKLLTRSAVQDQAAKINSKAIVVGNRGAQFVRRLSDVEMIAAFPSFGDHPTANDIRPVLSNIATLYTDGQVDEVQIIYTVHRSNILQEANSLTLLPARLEETIENSLDEVEFEPSIGAVVKHVAERLLEVQLWQAILESTASEHSMRMLSMKNATDNASDLIDDLTLVFNTARQASITQEIAEVTGGAEAMK